MTAWQAVQYVGGGFSLIAFVAAAIFYAYRERSRTNAAIIRSAPPGDRLDAIATVAEFFRVNVSGLSTDQQSAIVLEQLRIRSRRDFLFFYSFILLAILCGSVALAAIFFDNPSRPETKKIACDDKPAQYAETDMTRVVAFSYRTSDPGNPHVSNWSRPTSDRWVEKNDEGENLFSVERRINYGPCDGTVITKIGEPNLQLLISDKNCSSRGLLFRRTPSCAWIGLPKMQDVR
jgi:hypothetical protein